MSCRTPETIAWRWTDVIDPGWPDRHWTGEFLTTDDTTWYARIDGEGRPDLPPVVMIHGLVVSGAYFRPVARRLDQELRLFIPDLPGFGRSTTRVKNWSLADYADAIASWMHLHGLNGAVLVGNSLGCQMITLLAVRHPELVRSLVLVAPTMDPQSDSLAEIAARALMDVPRERPSIWQIWIPDFFRAGPRRALQALIAGMDDHQENRLECITQHSLVVGGEDDPIISVNWVRTMAARIPNGEAVILPGAAHAMNYSDPRALAAVIHRAVYATP